MLQSVQMIMVAGVSRCLDAMRGVSTRCLMVVTGRGKVHMLAMDPAHSTVLEFTLPCMHLVGKPRCVKTTLDVHASQVLVAGTSMLVLTVFARSGTGYCVTAKSELGATVALALAGPGGVEPESLPRAMMSCRIVADRHTFAQPDGVMVFVRDQCGVVAVYSAWSDTDELIATLQRDGCAGVILAPLYSHHEKSKANCPPMLCTFDAELIHKALTSAGPDDDVVSFTFASGYPLEIQTRMSCGLTARWMVAPLV